MLLEIYNLVPGLRLSAAMLLFAFTFAMFTNLNGQNPLSLTQYRLKGSQAFANGELWSVGGLGELTVTKNGSRRVVRISRYDLNGIFFLNDSTVVVVGNHGEIIVTTDRGISWKSQASGTRIDLQSVYCLDVETCWIVGKEKGLILFGGPNKIWKERIAQSVDNNRLFDASKISWRGRRVLNNGSFNDIFFVNRSTGYVVGKDGVVLKTENGGEDWIRIGIPFRLEVNEFIDGVPNFESVAFSDNSTGCIAGWDIGKGIVACTDDGGGRWRVSSIDVTPVGIFWNGNGAFYIFDKNGRHQVSTDLGNTWTAVPTNGGNARVSDLRYL